MPDRNALIVIPARYASTRLPGKPLAMIHGKSMIQHVYEKAAAVKNASVVVATESTAVKNEVELFGGNAIMTSPYHNSGTERMTEVMWRFDSYPVYVNLQGDEPMCRSDDIQLLVNTMQNDATLDSASLYHKISRKEAENPNTVKVVMNNYGNAMYFSRSIIPYPRYELENLEYNKHVGIYAYTFVSLRAFRNLPATSLSEVESLEQLKFISAGYDMNMLQIDPTGPAVDTQEDLDAVRKLMA